MPSLVNVRNTSAMNSSSQESSDDDMLFAGSSTSTSKLYEENMNADADPGYYESADGSVKGPMTPPTVGSENMLDAAAGKDGLKIFGMPLMYGPLDDVGKRVYEDTFEADLPVVFIHPGKPVINSKIFGESTDGGDSFSIFGAGKRVVNSIHSMYNISKVGGNRFISFKSNYREYYKYVQTMGLSLHTAMGIQNNFSFSDFMNNSSYGVPFYANASTSISESTSNDYGQAEFAQSINEQQQKIRDKKTLAGVNGLGEKIKTSMADTIKDVVTNVPVIGGLVGSFIESLDGNQMYYPDIWSNSSFSRDYNLEFRFYSPYGDSESIFRYVYLPFLALIVLGMPLQDGAYSYRQPFLTRVSCPGRFECECGIIQSINFIRGEERMWTQEGFPREITVSLSIRDLYPNLMATKTPSKLKYNIGLTSFIECMAGLRYDQLNLTKRLSMTLNKTANRVNETLSFNNLTNRGSDFKYNVASAAANFLR